MRTTRGLLKQGTVEQKAKFQRFQSNKHRNYTVEQVKTSLSAYDDKRFILNDGKNTLAHGHYMCDVNNVVNYLIDQVSMD